MTVLAPKPTDTLTASAIPSAIPTFSPAILAETLVADSAYLRECREINPVRRPGQIGYHGIFPGKSTGTNVENLLGTARNHSRIKDIEEWVFEGFNIYFEGSRVVSSVDVHEDPHLLLSLRELISQYGCPDVILAIDMSIDQPSGGYGLTEFTYLRNGMTFAFLDFPVPLSSKARVIRFIKPQSLATYLEKSGFVDETFNVVKPVSWSEAVR